MRSTDTQSRDNQLAELIGQAYEAALDPLVWPSVVQRIGDTFGGAAALVVNDPLAAFANLAETANFEPGFAKSYEAHYGRRSPWVVEFLNLQPGALLHRGLVPNLQLEPTEYYNDWLRPQGLRDALGGILDKANSKLSYAVVLRQARLGDFSVDDHRDFRLMLQNLMRALSVHAKLRRVSMLEIALFEALDRAGLAAFLATEDCRLIGQNQTADSILMERNALHTKYGMLGARHSNADSQLRQAVALACRSSHGQTVILPQAVAAGAAMVSLVMPISSSGSKAAELAFTGCERLALVLVKDPSQVPPVNTNILSTIFGLTPAEGRLLDELMTGRSLEDISETRNVRYNTLRTQLRSVMAKTETRRQGELIALATRYCALKIPEESS